MRCRTDKLVQVFDSVVPALSNSTFIVIILRRYT
jgi:hypothetical protein